MRYYIAHTESRWHLATGWGLHGNLLEKAVHHCMSYWEKLLHRKMLELDQVQIHLCAKDLETRLGRCRMYYFVTE
jgi:hypothetical protein